MAGNAREPTSHTKPRRPAAAIPTSLVDLAKQAEHLQAIRKEDLRRGDWIAVRTRNSWYSLFHLGDGAFLVSGGWFDQHRIAPATVTISGCTWGGTAILVDVIACIGLFIEFGNGVTTTRVREVHVLRGGACAPGEAEHGGSRAMFDAMNGSTQPYEPPGLATTQN